MQIRVGFGYDAHQLATGEELILGGIKIPYKKGTIAHSDGDVLIHAICDALLGAVNLRDIGYHFPDHCDEFKNISSMILLQKILDLLKNHGYEIGNIDTTICLQKPKLRDFIETIQQNLANALQIDANCVSIKATTTEKMGFVGKEKGISAYAVVLVTRIS